MDPTSLLSTIASLIAFAAGAVEVVKYHRAVERNRQEQLQRQLEEYDVLRLILTDSGRMILTHGQPSEAAQAAMLACTKRLKEFDDSLHSMRLLVEKSQAKKRSRVDLFRLLVKSEADGRKQQQAFQSFRDSVILLRDIASTQNHNAPSNGDDEVDSLSNQLASSERQEWNPVAYRDETGLDLEDLTRSRPKKNIVRPLLHTLVTSNYTFDATLVFQGDNSLIYVPARGFVDTGSSSFIISTNLLDRVGIPEDRWQRVEEETSLHGLEGAQFRPSHQVTLTWYLDRRKYSRVDTFFVANDDRFDILAPRSLADPGNGGESSTSREDGGLLLMLELRKKTEAERKQESIRHEEKDNEANDTIKQDREQRRQKRIAELQRREAEKAVSSSSASGTNTSSS